MRPKAGKDTETSETCSFRLTVMKCLNKHCSKVVSTCPSLWELVIEKVRVQNHRFIGSSVSQKIQN